MLISAFVSYCKLQCKTFRTTANLSNFRMQKSQYNKSTLSIFVLSKYLRDTINENKGNNKFSLKMDYLDQITQHPKMVQTILCQPSLMEQTFIQVFDIIYLKNPIYKINFHCVQQQSIRSNPVFIACNILTKLLIHSTEKGFIKLISSSYVNSRIYRLFIMFNSIQSFKYLQCKAHIIMQHIIITKTIQFQKQIIAKQIFPIAAIEEISAHYFLTMKRMRWQNESLLSITRGIRRAICKCNNYQCQKQYLSTDFNMHASNYIHSKSNVKFYKCSQCQLVYYCGKHCQKIDWIQHRKFCQNIK